MKKIVLSLLLIFALIPIVPSNTASAMKSKISLCGESLDKAGFQEELLAKCVSKANSFELSGPFLNPEQYEAIDAYQFEMRYGEYGDHSEIFSVSGGVRDYDFSSGKHTFTLSHSLWDKKINESFYIKKDHLYPVVYPLSTTLTFDLGEDGCYNCTIPCGRLDDPTDFSIVSFGDCGPVDPPPPKPEPAPNAPSYSPGTLSPAAIIGSACAFFGGSILFVSTLWCCLMHSS